MSDAGPTIPVALAEIKGDVKLILAGQERTNNDLRDLKLTVHRHGNEITELKAANILRDGEKAGLNKGGRLVWAIVSLVVGSSGVAALIEVLK